MAEVTPQTVVAPTPVVPGVKVVSKSVQFSQDVSGVEHSISSWHVNGWLLVGSIVLANVVGALFHV